MHNLDRDVLLFDNPCQSMTEAQEEQFFSILRKETGVESLHSYQNDGRYPSNEHSMFSSPTSTSTNDKVIVVTSTRFNSGQYADTIIVLVDGVVAQEGSYGELLAQPGPFQSGVTSTSPSAQVINSQYDMQSGYGMSDGSGSGSGEYFPHPMFRHNTNDYDGVGGVYYDPDRH